jgi:acyl carrier protein
VDPVLPRIQTLLREHFSLTPDQTAPERRLADLGIESLEAIEFLFKLEDEFGIALSNERGGFKTVADIVTVVEGALSERTRAGRAS